MTAASGTIAGVLKDGTKKERTFLTEEDHSSKKKNLQRSANCAESTMVCGSVKTSRR